MTRPFSNVLWRAAQQLRARSFRLPSGPGLLALASAGFAALSGRGRRLEDKLDRLSDDVQFIKRRMGTYIGNGAALTFLADGTPMIVNSDDYGGPMNLMVGGFYEQDNLDVLLSFLKPHDIAIDIGANLGFFALQFAQRIRVPGKVIAFEPHPRLHELLERNVYINGLRDFVECHNFGLSDRTGRSEFQYPHAHLGGGYVAQSPAENVTSIESELHKLDDVIVPGTPVGVVKIDVEGHELSVLNGMRRVIAESPEIAILLEKLTVNAGYEDGISALLREYGLEIHAVQPGAKLSPLNDERFRAFSGYVLAVRPGQDMPPSRSYFTVYPSQLRVLPIAIADHDGDEVRLRGDTGTMLFHGPYWFLPRGFWTLCIDGSLEGEISIILAGDHGKPVLELPFTNSITEQRFFLDHDISHFECIARVTGATASLSLRGLRFSKMTEVSLFREVFQGGSASMGALMRRLRAGPASEQRGQ